MVKRLTAKIGQYEKDGQTKGRYVAVGVIMSNDKGEYMLLDPSVNLAGVLMQQRILAQQTGGRVGDRVMVNVWDNDRQGGQQRNQQSNSQGYASGGGIGDDEIPF